MNARLFVGLSLPADVQEALGQLQGRLPPSYRPIPRENLHLTLHFLGRVPWERVPELQRRLGAIRCQPFELTTTQTGTFRTVAWLGLEHSPPLHRLNKQVVVATAPYGDTPLSFKPHVTLGRGER